MCYVSLTIDSSCAKAEDRSKVIEAAKQAREEKRYENMAECMQRAVQLNSNLVGDENDMFKEAYEKLVNQLYDQWKNAESFRQYEVVKKKLQNVVGDVMDLLESYILPSLEEYIKKKSTTDSVGVAFKYESFYRGMQIGILEFAKEFTADLKETDNLLAQAHHAKFLADNGAAVLKSCKLLD